MSRSGLIFITTEGVDHAFKFLSVYFSGFSNLMKDAPELMTSALLTHNNLIRKAKWDNIGFTIEQEGGGNLGYG